MGLSGGFLAGPAEGLDYFHAHLVVFDVLSSVVLAIEAQVVHHVGLGVRALHPLALARLLPVC